MISKEERDEDVFPYVYDTDIEYCHVTLDNYHLEISALLTSMIHDNINWLIKNKLLKKASRQCIQKGSIVT